MHFSENVSSAGQSISTDVALRLSYKKNAISLPAPLLHCFDLRLIYSERLYSNAQMEKKKAFLSLVHFVGRLVR